MRHWRTLRSMSQSELAAATFVSADLVAKIEKAERWPTHRFAALADDRLVAGGVLTRLWPLVEQERLGSDRGGPSTPVASASPLDALLVASLPGVGSLVSANGGARLTLQAGRVLPLTETDAWVEAVASTENSVVTVANREVRPAGSRRTLLIAEEQGDFDVRYFASERIARRIPRAYELDSLTLALIWSVSASDDALLFDDTALAESRQSIKVYEQLSGSAVAREAVASVSQLSQNWIGSDFCARYIWRSLVAEVETPLFWTREQRGEEASAWLLFRHKYLYLRRTQDRFGDSGQPQARVFCIPEAAVTDSSPAERVLMMLAAALMESFAITIHVVTEADYGAVEGFVLTRPNQVVIANWIRAQGLWHVDSSDAVASDIADAAGYGVHHSVVADATSAGRLALLAAYLDVDWPWLTRRCAELVLAGVDGLIRPRSRLLGIDGVRRACNYLGALR